MDAYPVPRPRLTHIPVQNRCVARLLMECLLAGRGEGVEVVRAVTRLGWWCRQVALNATRVFRAEKQRLGVGWGRVFTLLVWEELLGDTRRMHPRRQG